MKCLLWFVVSRIPGLAFVGRVEYFADVLEVLHEIVSTHVVSLQPFHDVLQPVNSDLGCNSAYRRGDPSSPSLLPY